jgi:membrane-bound serine protease (ClpP class)
MEGLLLSIGFIGLVVAILTPLTRTGSGVTLLSFATYFYLVGVETWLPVILFTAGLLLIVFEIFIPEFGLAGIVGIVLLIGGLHWTIGDISQTIRDLSMAVIITAILVIYLIRKGYSLANVNKLILQTNLADEFENGEKPEKSVVNLQPGLVGKTQTPLRPSGKVSFDDYEGPSFDVLSTEGHISKDTPVVIEKVQGTKILVRKQS